MTPMPARKAMTGLCMGAENSSGTRRCKAAAPAIDAGLVSTVPGPTKGHLFNNIKQKAKRYHRRLAEFYRDAADRGRVDLNVQSLGFQSLTILPRKH
jgi:hypothetical protein